MATDHLRDGFSLLLVKVLGVVFPHERHPLLPDLPDDGLCLAGVGSHLLGDQRGLREVVDALEVVHIDRDHDVSRLFHRLLPRRRHLL